jgi:hypothetical protein
MSERISIRQSGRQMDSLSPQSSNRSLLVFSERFGRSREDRIQPAYGAQAHSAVSSDQQASRMRTGQNVPT